MEFEEIKQGEESQWLDFGSVGTIREKDSSSENIRHCFEISIQNHFPQHVQGVQRHHFERSNLLTL